MNWRARYMSKFLWISKERSRPLYKTYSQSYIILRARKTSQIITQLKELGRGGGKLSEEKINASVTNEAAQQWLYRLASAELLI